MRVTEMVGNLSNVSHWYMGLGANDSFRRQSLFLCSWFQSHTAGSPIHSLCLCANYFAFLSLSLLICKMEINYRSHLKGVL